MRIPRHTPAPAVPLAMALCLAVAGCLDAQRAVVGAGGDVAAPGGGGAGGGGDTGGDEGGGPPEADGGGSTPGADGEDEGEDEGEGEGEGEGDQEGPDGEGEGEGEEGEEGEGEGEGEGSVGEGEGEGEGDPPTGRADGRPCVRDEECAGGACITEADNGFPGGYCTTVDCRSRADCHGEGNACFLGNRPTFCVHLCDDAADCREGYDCQRFGRNDTGICFPGEPEAEGPRDREDGAACDADGQCVGGTCLLPGQGYPGGYCTELQCGSREDCNGPDTACLLAGRPNYCIKLCDTAEDCRPGYDCRPVEGGGFCAPGAGGEEGVPSPEEGQTVFPPQCEAELMQRDAFPSGRDRRRIFWDLPSDATSFIVVPWSAGEAIASVTLRPPDGPALEVFEDYAHQSSNPSFLINMHPLTLPGAPQFEPFISDGGGEYTLDLASDVDICHVTVGKRGEGDHIDLNIYLVGLRDLNAANAQGDRRLQRALDRFDDIYAQVGVRLGEVRYLELDADAAAFNSTIRSEEQAFQLVSMSRAPGPGVEEQLSVNVFLVEAFAVGGGGVLGISSGLPGAAGVHGTRGSGLVFSAVTRDDPALFGQVLAHEVGHYLGLPHTTEQGGSTWDPFDDTPTCPRIDRVGDRCPDATNLMFPFAGTDHADLTDGQGMGLQANPLIRGERTTVLPGDPDPADGPPPDPDPVPGDDPGEGRGDGGGDGGGGGGGGDGNGGGAPTPGEEG